MMHLLDALPGNRKGQAGYREAMCGVMADGGHFV